MVSNGVKVLFELNDLLHLVSKFVLRATDETRQFATRFMRFWLVTER